MIQSINQSIMPNGLVFLLIKFTLA